MTVKCHDIERSLLEGILTRGDRRVAAALEAAWRRGARLDAWSEHFKPRLWWDTFADLGIDVPFYSHRERPIEEVLPWDHIHIKYGREYLAKEQTRSRRAARGDGRGGVTFGDSRFQIRVGESSGGDIMATVAQTKLLTAEEFMAADLGEGTFELVRGEVVEVPPPMPEHGVSVRNVAGYALETYGRKSGYGYALSRTTRPWSTERGPDTVRGPDVCFYSHARWPRSEVGKGLASVPPDLAVEVVSPGNRAGEISTKIAEYLAVGTLLVWVVYPASRSVVIHRSDDEPPVVLARGRRHRKSPRAPRLPLSRLRFLRLNPRGEPSPVVP